MKKTKEEWNELRLYANEIMYQLYRAGESEQLELLVSYGKVAIENIAKENKEGKKR